MITNISSGKGKPECMSSALDVIFMDFFSAPKFFCIIYFLKKDNHFVFGNHTLTVTRSRVLTIRLECISRGQTSKPLNTPYTFSNLDLFNICALTPHSIPVHVPNLKKI
ncbi:hypothetical protein HZS_2051 [Henneguya salminicola]|nr:hypothetical protein HZS_2051 [Henneguya salminicola]